MLVVIDTNKTERKNTQKKKKQQRRKKREWKVKMRKHAQRKTEEEERGTASEKSEGESVYRCPVILARYSTKLVLPAEVEPCSRTG
jgi:hypothetical protein